MLRLGFVTFAVTLLAAGCGSSTAKSTAQPTEVDLDANKPRITAAEAKASEIESELAQLEMQMLGSLSGGSAVDATLDTADGTAALPEAAAAPHTPAAGGSSQGAAGIARLDAHGSAAASEERKHVRGPTSEVVIAEPEVRGGAVDRASAVVARMRPRFRRCHAAALNEDPTLTGKLELTAKIGQNGEVLSVRETGGAMGKVTPCARAVVAGAQFAPPSGNGGYAEVIIRVGFSVK